MKAIVTGSFDPITLGHMDLIEYAAKNFDAVYVVALINDEKEYMFSLDEKRELIAASVSNYKNVIADAYNGFTADYMHRHGISVIVRGVRNSADEKYERELADKMNDFDPSFTTVLINCSKSHANLSSTFVREQIDNKKDLGGLIHPKAIELLKRWNKI